MALHLVSAKDAQAEQTLLSNNTAPRELVKMKM